MFLAFAVYCFLAIIGFAVGPAIEYIRPMFSRSEVFPSAVNKIVILFLLFAVLAAILLPALTFIADTGYSEWLGIVAFCAGAAASWFWRSFKNKSENKE